ncbi:hydrogenase maturation nickel metallochaperone HypA [Thermostaphylospora chromogena]|uniref:Hydrogenase nickel incorporation protein HypA/HybF n=1 Tax=Thermostaphylospora chromogena TaxID=35622 RepID=A0A1H1H5P6_9ACTN|nr:hydrogenase maturation nickel metallochaperone HypA [Thermostaphylospora chromogena]SDR20428.1 hydrogenase nickel incorporation protein HypA/HybF [Thermostaphylospora chromogena]
MHELGLCDAIVDATVRRAGGRKVGSVRVRVGGHPVDPAVIDMGFRMAAAGTVAEDARVEVINEPLGVRCRSCGGRTAAQDAVDLLACRHCGGLDVEASRQESVVVESITFHPADEGGGR